MPIAILNPRRFPLPLHPLRRVARAVLEAEGRPAAEVNLVYCDTETITALNRTYRQTDDPTDVLAFAQTGGPGGEELLGDVVVCVPIAEEQAERVGWSRDQELALLTLHGLLHLLGYDDVEAIEHERMQQREDEIFQTIFDQPVRRFPPATDHNES